MCSLSSVCNLVLFHMPSSILFLVLTFGLAGTTKPSQFTKTSFVPLCLMYCFSSNSGFYVTKPAEVFIYAVDDDDEDV